MNEKVYDIGIRLQELRKKQKLTQKEVAAILGVNKNTITKYENGNTKPSLKNLKRLAIIYKTSTDYILGVEDNYIICLYGLTESQSEIILCLYDELKQNN